MYALTRATVALRRSYQTRKTFFGRGVYNGEREGKGKKGERDLVAKLVSASDRLREGRVADERSQQIRARGSSTFIAPLKANQPPECYNFVLPTPETPASKVPLTIPLFS